MAVAINEESTPATSDFQPKWHRTAPARVVEKYHADDPIGGWTAWQKYLARRKRPELPAFHQGKAPALLWGLPSESGGENASVQLDVDAAIESALASAAPPPDMPEALQILALAHALPELAQTLPAEKWWKVVEQLHELAVDAQQHRVDWTGDPLDVVRQQLLGGELALTLSYSFPEITPLRGLRKSGRNVLSEALAEVTDGQGLPRARLLPLLGPLFACWTRCRWIGSRLSRGPWSRRSEYEYQWLVRHAIRLADASGRFVLSDGPSTWSKPLFSTALKLVGDDGDCAAANVALPKQVVPHEIKFDADDLPDPSLNSDWSGITVMSNGWSRSAVRLAISYADDPVHIELSVDGDRVLAGPWTFETKCDDEPVSVAADWEELCWQSDKHSDFLELGVELTAGLRLERQLLLGKKDRVLYVADLLIASDGKPRRLTHSMILPLDQNAEWQREAQTRDGQLLTRRSHLAVMPLALPEWRTDPRGGELTEHNGRLVLTQETHGRAMCCPLFFDLKAGRSKKERTWRQLTVAEWMEVVPRDAAVGFRAQSGRGQWLIYRSLGPAGNRTVMGQNIAGEFCAGRFHATGKFDDWLEIEAV